MGRPEGRMIRKSEDLPENQLAEIADGFSQQIDFG